jgi:hypothetical protein
VAKIELFFIPGTNQTDALTPVCYFFLSFAVATVVVHPEDCSKTKPLLTDEPEVTDSDFFPVNRASGKSSGAKLRHERHAGE